MNYFSEVWLNGEFAGSHEGGYTPFELDITKLAKAGDRNVVAVRVVDPPKRGAIRTAAFERNVVGEKVLAQPEEGIDGFVLDEVPNWKEQFYYNFGGIWQSVELVATGPVRVQDAFVEPRVVSRSITVHLALEGARPGCRLALQVTKEKDPANIVAQKEVPLDGNAHVREELAIPSPVLWSPDQPHLYRLVSRVVSGKETLDEVATVFGMREFAVENGDFLLNGKRIILKSALHQGFYPRTIAYPPDAGFARNEILTAKAAGLNMLRMHIKPSPPVFLDLADELGLLLQEEPPIGWLKKSPSQKERSAREVDWADRVGQSHAGQRERPSERCRVLRILAPSGAEACQATETVKIARSIQSLFQKEVKLSGKEEGPYLIKVQLKKDGRVLTENDFPCHVVDPSSGGRVESPFLLLDPEDNLRPWLKDKNIPFREFAAAGREPELVVVAAVKNSLNYYAINDELRQLGERVQNGDTAIFLEGNFNELMYLFLRFQIGLEGAQGTFLYVRPHPIFSGLPSGCLMDGEHTDITPLEMMKETTTGNLEPQVVVGSVSSKSGPWGWGSPLFVTSQGKGQGCSVDAQDQRQPRQESACRKAVPEHDPMGQGSREGQIAFRQAGVIIGSHAKVWSHPGVRTL